MGMAPRRTAFLLVGILLVCSLNMEQSSGMSNEEKAAMRDDVRGMFYHAYDNYMRHAFPHDELKPLSNTYTDSLGELGNLNLEHLSDTYNGTALTLVDSLSSLAVMGDRVEFKKAILWLSRNLSFDSDVRVNVFECNIRLLGGLISAHMLASLKESELMPDYNDELLPLALDLGRRLLPAFDTPTGIPYAWVNLKYGVRENETTETSTSGCGSLILELGLLSRLTGLPEYESAALGALRKLWSMRSRLDLLGTTLDVESGEWIEHSGSIGAGVDSFYEYLMKAHILFGKDEYWHMFRRAYSAVQRHLRFGPWYHEADMHTGQATHLQFTSLQAFWPGLQVLVGDLAAANATHRAFFDVWEKFGVFPERYLFDREVIHPTEKYYPLRPELAESTFALYQATRDPWYLEVGRSIVNSLNVRTRVSGGFASVRNVVTMELEDHMHSFFLAETCKYLYLLFDDEFLQSTNYIFSTEGHPLPVLARWRDALPGRPKGHDSSLGGTVPERKSGNYKPKERDVVEKEESRECFHGNSPMAAQMCPNWQRDKRGKCLSGVESACHVADKRPDYTCQLDAECGVDAATCRRRVCSPSGYCGLQA